MEFIPNLFPFLHVIILIAGIIVLLFIKKKYPKVKNYELIVVFVLFLILIAVFSEPGLDLLKRFINFIQV
jgi:hypothetical protein